MPGKDLAYLALQALEREESMYKCINYLIFLTMYYLHVSGYFDLSL